MTQKSSWTERCQFLGSSESLHPSKILLNLLAPDANGMSVYRAYLRETLNLNLSHANLGTMSDGMVGKFYGLSEPKSAPKFFDLEAGCCQDVSKLEACLGVRIIILAPSNKSGRFISLHNRSVYNLLGGKNAAPEETLILCMDKKGRQNSNCRLYKCPDMMGYDPLEHMVSRGYVSSAAQCPAEGECLVAFFARLLGRAELAHHSHDDFCADLSLVMSDWRRLRRLIASPSFVIVTHLRSSLVSSGRMVKEFFGMLNSPPEPCLESEALCMLSDGRFFLMRRDKVPALLTPEARSRRPKAADMPPPMTGIKAGACHSEKAGAERPATFSCSCEGCSEAGNYALNMAESGPPELYKHEVTLFDLLKTVGLFSKASETLVNECCALSVGSLDVETFSLKVGEEAGNEDCQFPYKSVGGRGLPRDVKARMVPVLIGYCDTLMLKKAEGENVKIFGGWSEKDEATDKYDMVAAFAEFVRGRQELAAARKLDLLAPLLDWTEKYFEAFTTFFRERNSKEDISSDDDLDEVLEDEFLRHLMALPGKELESDWGDELEEETLKEDLLTIREGRLEDSVEKAFDSTVFGKIRRALKKLLKVFVVYAFNGQRFDFVVLAGDLCCHFKSRGKQVKISREGLAVKSISVSGSLEFREAGFLLSPGTSLDALGKLVGLEIRKFRFPFEMLSTFAFLRQPRLPADKKAWESSLTSLKSQPTQEEVDYFLDLYDREGHACVGDFLVRYLRLDCLILQRSMLKVVEGYYHLLGVNLIQSFKMTISSLSSFGVQAEMFRRKMIGFFFCNNARIYSCLKHGTRGGYVAVHNTVSGSKADVSEYADLLEELLASADTEEERNRIAPNLEAYPTTEAYLRACNPHTAEPGRIRQPANFIQYLDVNSLYGTAARSTLPFGAATFYSLEERCGERVRRRRPRERRGEDYGGRCVDPSAVLSRGQLFRAEKRGIKSERPRLAPVDYMSVEESAFAQYMALAVFPEATFVYSAFHSSCGQLTFGSSHRMKADLTLVCGGSGGVAKVTVVVCNFHGRYYHNGACHYEDCPLFSEASTLEPAEERLLDYQRSSAKTERDDSAKTGLAVALSSVDPNLRVVYATVTSCDLFCRKGNFLRPSTIRSRVFGYEEDGLGLDSNLDGFSGLREMLATRFPRESVLGYPTSSLTVGDLMNRIMYSGNCHDNTTHMGGFVVITGGEERVKSDREKAFGFCFQRSKVRRDELGPWTLRCAEMLASQKLGLPPGDAKVVKARNKILDDLLKEPLTLARRSFGGSTECLSLDFFRWLVRERGLEGIELKHYIHMSEKNWLSEFFTGLLQARHDLKKRPDSALRRDQLKLIVNGFYGFNAIQATSYPKTSVVNEGTLSRLSKEERLRKMLPTRGIAVTLMGCTKPKKGRPDLVYGISRWNKDADIVNTLQVAATILSMSKVIFFSHLLSILRHFDPGKVALLYSDTDSLIIGTTHLELEKCFDGESSGLSFDVVADRLLEDPTSQREQSGKLKIEAVYLSGYFRGSKAYFLGHSVEDGKSMARMRSVPRALHPRLGEEKFKQDPRKNAAVVTYVNMFPTRGLEIVKARQSRALSVALNTKLFAVNPVHTTMLP